MHWPSPACRLGAAQWLVAMLVFDLSNPELSGWALPIPSFIPPSAGILSAVFCFIITQVSHLERCHCQLTALREARSPACRLGVTWWLASMATFVLI